MRFHALITAILTEKNNSIFPFTHAEGWKLKIKKVEASEKTKIQLFFNLSTSSIKISEY